MGSARRSTIYLDPELHRRIRLAGADGDRTISELVNAAVAHFLAAGGVDGAASDALPAPAAAAASPAVATEATATPMAAAVLTAAAAPAGLPAFREPPAALPAGLAPPVRRLFGALRPADADAADARDARLARHGA